MSRPQRLEELETIYTSLTQRSAAGAKRYMSDDSNYCLAIYATDYWTLDPYSWGRLTTWLQPLLSEGILFTPEPQGSEGRLHVTFHQCSHFGASAAPPISSQALEAFLAPLKGLHIVFRGLCITPTGIALRGYPADDAQLCSLMNLRAALGPFLEANGVPFDPPYTNDLCHATLFRWTKEPSAAAIKYLETLSRWDECVFGQFAPSSWMYGLANLRLLGLQPSTGAHVPMTLAHRGNVSGQSRAENTWVQLSSCIERGITVECDVWRVGGTLFLGHDEPAEPIEFERLCSPYILVHAKHGPALEYLLQKRRHGAPINLFWHTTEDYVLTTAGDVIVYPGKPLLDPSMCMMPERCGITVPRAHQICSDF